MYMDIWYYAYIWYILISGMSMISKISITSSWWWVSTFHIVVTQLASDIVTPQTGSKLQWNVPGHLLPKAGCVTCERCYWILALECHLRCQEVDGKRFRICGRASHPRTARRATWLKATCLTFGVLPPNAVLCLDVRSRNPVQLEDIWYLGFAMGFWTFLHLCQIPRDVSFAKDIAALPLQLLWGKQGHLGCKNSHLLFERPNFRLENLWEWITKLATVHVDCLSNASPQSCRVFWWALWGWFEKTCQRVPKHCADGKQWGWEREGLAFILS